MDCAGAELTSRAPAEPVKQKAIAIVQTGNTLFFMAANSSNGKFYSVTGKEAP
jgi:hypothetical protein